MSQVPAAEQVGRRRELQFGFGLREVEMALAPGTRLGPYEISSPLGAGGMGEVYRAKDTRLGRSVAIKVLPPDLASDPERRRRFEQEARAVSALNHPNICALYDIGSVSLPGAPALDYLVMEFLEGQSLADRIAKGPMPVRDALECAAQVADALSKAHRQGVIHRDIKPGNVILTKEGAKLLDFGLAKARPTATALEATATQSISSSPVTQAGVVVGTVPYMAPEQLEGREADARTDIFSFGAMLYEMLSGRRAFEGASQASIIATIMTADPPPLSEHQPLTPAPVERLVRQCLAKDPDKRWQSAGDIARHLEGMLEELRLPSSATGIPVTAVPPRSRLKRLSYLTAAIFGAGLLAIAACLVGTRIYDRPLPSFRKLTFRRGVVDRVFFTPDGRSVVYTARWDGQPRETFTVQVDGVDSVVREGLTGALAVAISSKNELALLTGSTLATAPLAAGKPRALLKPIRHADWSPDGSQFAVIRSYPTPFKLEYPAGKAIYTGRTNSITLSDVRVSPRGDFLALMEHNITHGWIVVVDTAGNKKTESSFHDELTPPCWTPAGDEVWFSCRTTSGKEIRALNLAGQERGVLRGTSLSVRDISREGRVLLSADDTVHSIQGKAPRDTVERNLTYYGWSLLNDLSPDGRTILFMEGGESDRQNQWDVFLRGMDGSPPQRLGGGVYGKLSPDGKWIAAKNDEGVVLIPSGTGEQRQITRAQDENGVVAWLPDSSALIYAGGNRSWLAPVDGRPPKPLLADGWAPLDISPDGKYVLGTPFAPGDLRISLFSLDGTEKSNCPGLDQSKWNFVGFHDTTRVRVTPRPGSGIKVAGPPPVSVYLLDINSGKAEPWKEIGAQIPRAGFLGYVNAKFSADGQSYAYGYGNTLSTLYVVEGLK